MLNQTEWLLQQESDIKLTELVGGIAENSINTIFEKKVDISDSKDVVYCSDEEKPEASYSVGTEISNNTTKVNTPAKQSISSNKMTLRRRTSDEQPSTSKIHERSNSAINHNRTQKLFLCHFCNKRFAGRSNLNSHKKIHTGEKLFQCQYCDKKFAVRSNFTSH